MRLNGVAAHWPLALHDVVFALIEVAPRVDQWHTRLTKAAYRKGLEMGLNIDVGSRQWRDNPYSNKVAAHNFARGGNDARAAWNAGSLDGQRIRLLVQTADHTTLELTPPLLHREHRAIVKYKPAGVVPAVAG